ncbi:MAG: transporter related [Rhizobacter sp.]|nr:transporter related [Rhizobacter sp.]
MSQLQLDHLTKRFADQHVVRDMHLDVADGEFIVLVGASGCGKSTTLRMIAGLESPSSGQIRIGGRDVTHASPAQRDIAMVFQNYALYPHLNVAENMGFALSLAGTDRATIRKRVDDAARILGIEALLKRKPRELSGGQRQRVAMGRAIVREPKVFLFDEPLSNLDAKLRGHMRTEIALLHKRLAKTTVYVTHDQVEAMTLADRIVVMDGGLVQQMGSPDAVFNQPVNRFVAGFIGSPTMNFLPVDVVREPDGLSFRAPGVSVRVPEAMVLHAAQLPDGKAVLGVRPQALRLGAATSAADLQLSVTVDVCEYLGTETHLMCGGPHGADWRLCVTAAGRHTALDGQLVEISAAAIDLHAFAPGPHGATLNVDHRLPA